MKKLLFFILLSVMVGGLSSVYGQTQQINKTQQALNKAGKSFFIQNKGQWNPDVKYLARIGGMNAWITNSGVVYDYYRITKNPVETKTKKMNRLQKLLDENKNTTIQGHVVRMQLVNAGKDIICAGNNLHEGYYNYFIGKNSSKWASNVPLYDTVELQGVYKNISVKYYFDKGMLRYDYKAKPGADLSQIKLKFDGQDGISINANGELVLKTSIGEVTHGNIYAYQNDGETQNEVACKFEQREDGTIGLKAGEYDANKELIIDPLVYSTFIGKSIFFKFDAKIYGNSIAIDANRNAYITGSTLSSNYPTTIGAYQTTFNSWEDAFVTKLNSTGDSLVYSTFIGSIDGHLNLHNIDSSGFVTSIAVDIDGNAYITGLSQSLNYPITNYLSDSGGVFVTKLNATGDTLIYSTYIGPAFGLSIAIDASGNAYITGVAVSSRKYTTTSGAFQDTCPGHQSAFVTKLNSTGDSLVYSTYVGGNGWDEGHSIAIDANGNAYITGETWSTNYPTTKGAFKTSYPGTVDEDSDKTGVSFITKLNSTGSDLVYSTFIGGNGNNNFSQADDEGNSIAVDANGNAYITGYTVSTNFPTKNAYRDTLNANYGNVFVTKLNAKGDTLIYSTYIGGSGNNTAQSGDFGNSIAIDKSGNAYITGVTTSSNYPTTSGAYQTAFTGGENAFVTELNPTGSALTYSTYLGADSTIGSSIALDTNGNVYITGLTNSSKYPNTSGAFDTTFSSGWTAFVTKLGISNGTGSGYMISGYVKYDNKDSTAMTKTKVYLENSGDIKIDSTTTDATGNYVFKNIINGTYKLTCSTIEPWGGVTPVDALVVNRYYIGLYPITDTLKLLAADVNNDKKINPVDALMINRRYIGLLNKYIIPDWLFTCNNSYRFPNPTITIDNIDITKNIIAICAGDVKGAYIPPPRVMSYKLGVMSNISIDIDLKKPFDIPIYLNDNVELGAIGLKFKVYLTPNPSPIGEGNSIFKVLGIKSDIDGLIYNLTENQESRTKNQEINIAWAAENEGYNVTPDKPLFVVSCSLIVDSKSLSSFQLPTSSFQITSESVLADIDENLISTDKLFLPEISFKFQASSFKLQIYPNPFNNITNINYTIPEDANVEMDFYNVLGEKVAALVTTSTGSVTEQQKAGQYTIKYDGSNLRQGVYYCRIDATSSSSTYTKTNIMVIAR